MQCAKFVNLRVGARCLSSKLVAGDVQDFESLVVVVLIHFFDRRIMGRKTATRRRVHDKNHFAFEFGQFEFCSVCPQNGIIIY